MFYGLTLITLNGLIHYNNNNNNNNNLSHLMNVNIPTCSIFFCSIFHVVNNSSAILGVITGRFSFTYVP